jgi:hypothetical protein
MDLKDKTIEDLKLKLEEQIAVKKNEVGINHEYKQIILKQEMQINLLNQINDRLYNTIADLRLRLDNLNKS